MSEYLIKSETLESMANHMRRISGSTDSLSMGEILETFSRTEGTIKTTGEYTVESRFNAGSIKKTGNYDTGEVFALPDMSDSQISYQLYNTETGWGKIPVGIFNGWLAPFKITNNCVTVNNENILICATYKLIDDGLYFHVKISNTVDPIIINFPFKTGMKYSIDGGDYVEITADQNFYSFSLPQIVGEHIIKIIPKDPNNKIQCQYINLGYNDYTRKAIYGLYIPKWIEVRSMFHCICHMMILKQISVLLI